MTLLIDGDVIAYRAGFACEKVVYSFTGGGHSYGQLSHQDIKELKKKYPTHEIERHITVEPVENALSNTDQIFQGIEAYFPGWKRRVFVTGKGNFRETLATIRKYKGNRDKSRRSVHHQAVMEHLRKAYGAEVVDGQEADDALGINQTADTVIVTVDKDLLQVPGQHFNFVAGKERQINQQTADRNLYMQILQGDSGDNIPGCPSVGPKRAEKIIPVADTATMFRAVRRAYREAQDKWQKYNISFDGEYFHYNSWRTGAPMQKSLDEFLDEIANLCYIRRKTLDKWERPA